MKLLALILISLAALPAFANSLDCANLYARLEAIGLDSERRGQLLAQLDALPPQDREIVAKLIAELPPTSTLPVWLRRIQQQAHFWREGQIAAVLNVLVREEGQMEQLLQRALQSPGSLKLEERRAVFLYTSQKWWFNEDISLLRRFSMDRLRPTNLLSRGEIPFEDLLRNRNNPGFWKSLLQLHASAREVARVVGNSSGAVRMSRLVELRLSELAKEINSLPASLERMRLEHEVARLRMVRELLETQPGDWADTIQLFAREEAAGEKHLRWKRFLFEWGPASARAVEDVAAYSLVFSVMLYGLEKAVPHPEPATPTPFPGTASSGSEAEKLRPVGPPPPESELDRAIRDFNEGRLSAEDLKKRYPHFFAR